jgi:hypothetical protein
MTETWDEVVRQQERSGMKPTEFCRELGIDPKTRTPAACVYAWGLDTRVGLDWLACGLKRNTALVPRREGGACFFSSTRGRLPFFHCTWR